MPLPNPQIITALFESYINNRKPTWGLDGDKVILPSAPVPADKIQTCMNLLSKLPNNLPTEMEDQSIQNWMNMIFLLAEAAKEEEIKFQKEWYGLKKYLYTPAFYLQKMLLAAVSYIINQLHDEPQFIHTLQDLVNRHKNLDKSIQYDKSKQVANDIVDKKEQELIIIQKRIEALNNSRDYYDSYFKTITLKNDPECERLKEANFTDYENNVLNGKRKPKSCEAYLAMMLSKQSQKEETKEKSSTSSSMDNAATTQSTDSAHEGPSDSISIVKAMSTFKPPYEVREKKAKSRPSDRHDKHSNGIKRFR